MKSPFPGMDPFLERSWRDVHSRLTTAASAALNGILPVDLVARVEERVVVDSADYARPRAIFPDTRIYEDTNFPPDASAAPRTLGSTLAEPILLELEAEEAVEAFIQILDPDGGRLVTVIEFLSPSNKLPGENREMYRKKRGELAGAGVHLVEIDLVRAGSWRDLLRPLIAPRNVQSAYRVIIRRVSPVRRAQLYPISIRMPLPTIPLPLRDSDPDVPLNLQSVLDQVYREGRHDRTRYDESCEPPLEGDDAQWADALLREADRNP
ncbi:MAG TPA: DUF4058 family protein [Tepidisphaeraceae bacterium]|jgi:hypothetical protein|nr:DUF4058 family protein [Tepidisphaeraceae bacterium]